MEVGGKRIRIAEVIATFPPHHGGMGYVCFHNSLELVRRGHNVTVFTLDHGRLDYENDPRDFRIIRLKTPLIYGDGGAVPQLYSELKGFDVIHLHYPFFGGAEYVYLASVLRKQPYFLTYHMDVRGDTLLKRAVINVYEPLLMKRILRKAGVVGALNLEHLKSSKAAGLIDWKKVVEMPNGVDIERFQPREKSNDLIRKHGLKDKVVVLFVGNLQPFKGLHLLINAIERIKDERIVLLIVGGGYSERGYREMVREKALEKRVIFAGPQSPEKDLPAYYNLCDFLVLPSMHSESFGLVVLEAMASGKPTIVSSLPGPSQLIEDGKDGLIAKVGDIEDIKNKVEYLSKEKALCQSMGLAAREKVLQKYNWAKIGEHLEKVLYKIVKKGE